MNILKITAIIAVVITLTACADQAVEQGTVTKDVTSSKL